MSTSTDHLLVKQKLVEDQKMLAKKFLRETKKISSTYDKPNQLYQRIFNAIFCSTYATECARIQHNQGEKESVLHPEAK